MSTFLLALALAASAQALADEAGPRVSCAVGVATYDDEGRLRAARRVSPLVPAVVFRGRVSPTDAAAPPLVFDVFNPRGQRYQALVATPRADAAGERGERRTRRPKVSEATLAVAGSSIVWTSMYGRWRVEPRLEGTSEPCGRAQFFTIRP